MSAGGVPTVVAPAALSLLLQEPRYEVIPARGIEQKTAVLPAGTTVTVTASPSLGLDRTLEASVALAARGLRVVPHFSARMVAGRDHLRRLVGRLEGTDIREVFVVGGDADPPAGDFVDAGDLLEELAAMTHPFTRIGIGGYPEGHPLIPDDKLLAALKRKQPYATPGHAALFRRGRPRPLARSSEGTSVPASSACPRRTTQAAEISLKAGVGASLSYLRKHGRQLVTLARSRRYDPTGLAREVAEYAADGSLDIRGAHLFTFNQVEPTLDWVQRSS